MHQPEKRSTPIPQVTQCNNVVLVYHCTSAPAGQVQSGAVYDGTVEPTPKRNRNNDNNGNMVIIYFIIMKSRSRAHTRCGYLL